MSELHQIKDYLRVDHDRDDFVIERLYAAAQAYVFNLCEDFVDEAGDPTDPPEDVKQAILFLVSHWYDSRGVIYTGRARGDEIPFTVSALLSSYRPYFKDVDDD